MSASKNDLRILYVITKSNWGGAQKYVHDMAVAARERYNVAVALGGNGVLAEKLATMHIPVHLVDAFQRDISFGKEIKVFFELFRLFRRLRPLIVHLNSSKAGGLGALAAQLAGVPRVVYTSHGLPFEEERPWWQKSLIAFFTWITFLLCDEVIIITSDNLRKARRMLFVGKRLRFIRLGITPPPLVSRQEARTLLMHKSAMPASAANATWIGIIAEYHPNKGLPFLVAAMDILREQHPSAILVLIGGGELEHELREMIADRQLADTVFLAGFVDNAGTLLSAFDIFTLTSLKEGLPYTVLEAGSAALPFVGTAIQGIQEVVTDMQTGILVHPKQPEEIATALSRFLDDPERRALYGTALKARVLHDFSGKKMIDETLALYDAAIDRNGKRD